LAEQLRKNLKRRKEQARMRTRVAERCDSVSAEACEADETSVKPAPEDTPAAGTKQDTT